MTATIPSLHVLDETRLALTRATIAAQSREVRTALVTLAVAARTAHPAVTHVGIDTSDMDGAYSAGDLFDAAGESLTDDTEVWADHEAYAIADRACASIHRTGTEHDRFTAVLHTESAMPTYALDVAAILDNADELLNQSTGDLPVIAFDGEAAESWSLAFDNFHSYNAHITLANGERIPVQIEGSGQSKDGDFLYGIEFKRVTDTEDWEPAPNAPIEFLAAHEFTRIQF